MSTKEYQLLDDESEAPRLIQFKGRELVVRQKKTDEISGIDYVIVPGFKVGGPHASTSRYFTTLQALDVELVGNDDREAIKQLLRELGFKGPISFW